jgi:GDSL-like Lipase/Acylhydrolase.
MSASTTYVLTITSGNYKIESADFPNGNVGAVNNIAVNFDSEEEFVKITDKAYRNWAPILEAYANQIEIVDASRGYDHVTMTFENLITYLQTIIRPESGGGGGGDNPVWGTITGSISSQTDLNLALGDKVDKVNGKGLSTNDFTDAEKNKLSGIEQGAQANVQSDWNQSNSASPDFIKNKPQIPSLPIEQYEVNGLVKKCYNLDYISGAYFSLAKNIGDSVNINSPVENANGYYLVIPITEYFEKVILHSYNSSESTRPYAILNSSGVILSMFDWTGHFASGYVVEIKKTDLPQNAAYIVCDSWYRNTYNDGHYAEIYEGVGQRVDTMNPLFGKRVVVFGDSIAEGVDNGYKSFAEYLQDKYGCKVTKLAVGGTHLTPSSLSASQSFNGYSVYHLITAWCTQNYTIMDATTDYIANETQYGDRWTHVPSTIKSTRPMDFDIVLILAGTNDWNNAGRVLGNWSDTNPVYNYTATIKSIVNGLKSVNPNIQVVFATPPVRWIDYNSSNPDTTKFSDNIANPNSGLMLVDVAERIMSVAVRCKVDAVDVYEGMGVNEVNFSTFFASGGVHPNQSGQLRITELIGQLLSTNVRGGYPNHLHDNKKFLDTLNQSAWDSKLSYAPAVTEDQWSQMTPIAGTFYIILENPQQ